MMFRYPASHQYIQEVGILPHVLLTSHFSPLLFISHLTPHTPIPHSHPHMSSHTTPHLTLALPSSPCLTPHCDPTPHMHPLPLSQVLKNSLQESQARCQELGAEKNEAQAKLDQLNAEKTSIEQQLVEAKRSVEETKVAVSMLRSRHITTHTGPEVS